MLQVLDTNIDRKKYWTNQEVIEKFFDKSVTPQILGRALNKISENFPDLVSIKRGSKGIRYYMGFKVKESV